MIDHINEHVIAATAAISTTKRCGFVREILAKLREKNAIGFLN